MDIHISDSGIREVWRLLFQLDSDYWKNQWRILWGDAGVGAFFINSKKLEELDFGDVLYNWDCH